MSGIYSLYKKMSHLTMVSTLAFFVSDRISGLWDENRRYVCKSIKKNVDYKQKNPSSIKDLKIAYVCDEMTYKSFSDLTDSVYLTPWNWYEILEKEKPDIFFCESAWSGIGEYGDCWRGRIYKSDKVKYNNRKVLFNILEYCEANGIKTVFWNKEDPTFFGNTSYDFIDTALHFNYIFTTAEECVERYKERGAKHVYVLPFGFSPKLFNPMDSCEKENRAVFAGSWYPEHKERCKQMKAMFDEVLEKGIRLHIFDRNADVKETVNVFPEEYQDYVHGKVPFEELGKEIKKSQYGININTVVNSSTMFARRVYEMMACNVCVISNESQGIRNQFPERVWFVGEEFDTSKTKGICRANVQEVLEKHTNESRLRNIFKEIYGIAESEKICVAIITDAPKDDCENEYVQVRYYKNLQDITDENYFILEDECTFSPDEIYGMLVHYQYLDSNVAIRISESDRYCFVEENKYKDALISVKLMNSVINNKLIQIYSV